MTPRSFSLQDNPSTATVAACYSKRKRQDSQILHPEVVRRLSDWISKKPGLMADELLFPVSGRVPGGTERKTHKMMRLDLDAARTRWISEGQTAEEQELRSRSDFLSYESEDGLFADFHSNRHMFITSLEKAGLSPKMAQTLARHSDVRLTLGVYTHVGLHDQTMAIGALAAPPGMGSPSKAEASVLRATGTFGASDLPSAKTPSKKVPAMVPCGAQNGAKQLAPEPPQFAPDCTVERRQLKENGDPRIAITPDCNSTLRIQRDQATSLCISENRTGQKVSPSGLEPLTFGFGCRSQILAKPMRV